MTGAVSELRKSLVPVGQYMHMSHIPAISDRVLSVMPSSDAPLLRANWARW